MSLPSCSQQPREAGVPMGHRGQGTRPRGPGLGLPAAPFSLPLPVKGPVFVSRVAPSSPLLCVSATREMTSRGLMGPLFPARRPDRGDSTFARLCLPPSRAASGRGGRSAPGLTNWTQAARGEKRCFYYCRQSQRAAPRCNGGRASAQSGPFKRPPPTGAEGPPGACWLWEGVDRCPRGGR